MEMSREDSATGAATPARAPLIGREAELSALARALDAVERERSTRTVTLVGPPGIGKSRLARDFLERRRQGSAALRVYSGSAGDMASAYGIFTRLLRARFGLSDGMDKDAARAEVRAQVAHVMGDRKVGDVIYFLGQFIGLAFGDSPLTRAVQDDPAQADLIRRAVLKAFLEADAAQGPVCLVFEDLHAAHDDSLALLRYLIEYLAGPVLIVCAARPELLTREDDWGKVGERRHALVELTPLGEAESAELARALLAPCMPRGGEDDVVVVDAAGAESQRRPGAPPELVESACSFANGNPALIEQMVRICLDQGVIEELAPDSGGPRWRVHLGKLSTAHLPMTVEDAVNVRLAALDHDCRQLLEQAATIGPVFWSGALFVLGRAGCQAPELWGEEQSDKDLDRINAALRSLCDRGYLRKQSESSFAGSDEYVFVHDKEREALQKRMSAAAQRRYHHAVAEWLEQQVAVRASEEFLAELATHRERIGDAVRAGLSLLDAGDVARGRYSNAKAAEYYARGLSLLGDAHVARRIDALHDYGDVLQLAGRIDDALAAFREMLTLAYRLDNRRKGGAAHNRIGRLYRDSGSLDEAGKHLTTALRLFEGARDERGIASTIDDIGKLHWLRGEYQEALKWLRDALARRERMGDRRSIALSLNNLGLALQDSGEFKQALNTFERSLAIRREISDLLGVVMSLNNLGMIAQDQRDHRRALKLFEEALEVARQVGDRNRTALILTNIGGTLYRSGDPDEAVRVLQQAEELCDELGDRLGLAEARRALGKAYMLRGDLEKARDSISRAVDLFASVRSKVHLGIALRTLGEITAAGGWGSANTKSARAYFARSVSIFEETGNELELARTFQAYARFLTTDRSFVANMAARREAVTMNERAEAIFARLKVTSVRFEDEPTLPTGPPGLSKSPVGSSPGRSATTPEEPLLPSPGRASTSS
ncbi:ATP-binding protein [Sorangium sp. So ce1078]|uniref:ATP-binding protein n=1 Tax=Sorangium sp. So ce1078 TaxID=3133329 RepID=UPI003F6475A0